MGSEFLGGLLFLGEPLLASTSDETSSAGGDETDLSTRGGRPLDGTGRANMLMVTTTVGMLHGVHSHTSHSGPAVPLDL